MRACARTHVRYGTYGIMINPKCYLNGQLVLTCSPLYIKGTYYPASHTKVLMRYFIGYEINGIL